MADSVEKKVLKLANKGGILRPRDLQRKGLPADYLWRLYQKGKLERVGRGMYALTGASVSEYQTLAQAARRVPHGIVCHAAIRPPQSRRGKSKIYANFGCLGLLALSVACATNNTSRQASVSTATPSPVTVSLNTPETALAVPVEFKPAYVFLRAEDSSIADRNTLEPIRRKTVSITLPDGLDRHTVDLNLKHAAKDLYIPVLVQ